MNGDRWQACPVCGGRGTVPNGFYSLSTIATSTMPERCRTCGGGTVIPMPRQDGLWSPGEPEPPVAPFTPMAEP